MDSQKTKASTGLFSFERGGLTSKAPEEAVEAVMGFAYCANCDAEVPFDSEEFCLYCFKKIESAGGEREAAKS